MQQFEVNDKVVFRYNGVNQIAVVTNIRKIKNSPIMYDLRAENGSGHIIVPVDKKKSNPVIDAHLTAAWVGNGGETNLYVNKNLGHTRANYGENVEIRIDGELRDNSRLWIGQIEKYNDFHFPCQGPRSF